MKKIPYAFLLLSVLTLLTCCKKEDNPMPAWPIIKTRTIDGDVTEYKYGNMWKIVSVDDDYYNYSGNTITSNFTKFTLNDQDLAILCELVDMAPYSISYDINGYAAVVNGTQQVYNADSNLVVSYFPYNGSNVSFSHYTYLPQANTIGNFNHGKYYMGRSSKNLVSEELYYTIDSQGDTTLKRQNLYQYTFDNVGRVESKREKWVILPAGDTILNNLSEYAYY